jgi:hypothetical protein
MDDAETQAGQVVLTFEFRPSEARVPRSEGPLGSAIVGNWALSFDELEELFNGNPLAPTSLEQQQIIFYPRAADGNWVARDVVSLTIERRPDALISAQFELLNTRDDVMAHKGDTPVPSAIATFEGPMSVTCNVLSPGTERILLEDARFESPFCVEFLSRLALE